MSLAETDGDQGLADRDDHDQPVTLDEVRRLHAPAAQPTEEWYEVADRERGQPEQRLDPSVDEPGDHDQSGAGEGRRSDPQNRRQQVGVATRCKRVKRQMHDRDEQERHPEQDAVCAERIRDGERGDEHRSRRSQHRCQHGAETGVDGVRQPGV